MSAPVGFEPRIVIEHRPHRGRLRRWRVWVEGGRIEGARLPSCLRIEGELGTYAATRKRALRKGRKLLAYAQRFYATEREVVSHD